MIHHIFWLILGLGLATPATLVIITNLILKAVNGDKYEISLSQTFKVYLVALIGWAMTFGIS